MNGPIEWRLGEGEQTAVVTLRGAITESANFTALLEQLRDRKQLTFDLWDVERINSWGVREWISLMKRLSSEGEVSLSRCSPALVAQLNGIQAFTGGASVLSVAVPFLCSGCGEEELKEFSVAECVDPKLSGHTCHSCGESLEFDDLPARYFSFVRDPTVPKGRGKA